MAEERPAGGPVVGPVVAPSGASPALASRPDRPLEEARYHTYESHPAPWWVALLWAAFFVFGVTYLITNLLE
jgi:hypothetical protein